MRRLIFEDLQTELPPVQTEMLRRLYQSIYSLRFVIRFISNDTYDFKEIEKTINQQAEQTVNKWGWK